MLGYKPVPYRELTDDKLMNASMDHGWTATIDQFDEVNKKLADYAEWEKLLDSAIVITTPNSEIIQQWRREDMRLYASRFVPFYDVNMSKLREEGIQSLDESKQLRFEIGESKMPIESNSEEEDFYA